MSTEKHTGKRGEGSLAVQYQETTGETSAASQDLPEPASPCVSVCALDENDICMGCYRSADEITDWFMASKQEKYAMLKVAEARRQKDSPIRLL